MPRADKGSRGHTETTLLERAVALDDAEHTAATVNSHFSHLEDEFQGTKGKATMPSHFSPCEDYLALLTVKL